MVQPQYCFIQPVFLQDSRYWQKVSRQVIGWRMGIFSPLCAMKILATAVFLSEAGPQRLHDILPALKEVKPGFWLTGSLSPAGFPSLGGSLALTSLSLRLGPLLRQAMGGAAKAFFRCLTQPSLASSFQGSLVDAVDSLEFHWRTSVPFVLELYLSSTGELKVHWSSWGCSWTWPSCATARGVSRSRAFTEVQIL